MANAQQTQSARNRNIKLPGQELSLEETLRVMDVARELRDQRQTAEKMFEREGVRAQLRDKLVRQARVLNEDVTEGEIDAAIDQYMSTLHRYQDPPRGFKNFMAHCWVWRDKILWSLAGVTAAGVGAWWFFS